MESLKIGVIREGKIPSDERVPLVPEQCKWIKEHYPHVDVVVQKSEVRRIEDQEYIERGIDIVEDVSDCDVLMGVKEVPKKELIPDKTYFFFSHTIKMQPYNRDLLRAVLNNNISLIDYETLTEESGRRLIGFGRYAGIVGAYNTLRAYGKRSRDFDLKPAYKCVDRKEMESELKKVELPPKFKIVLTGKGRVSGGAVETLEKLGLKEVSAEEYLSRSFDEPVYTVLGVTDYVCKAGGHEFTESEFFENPIGFESDFMRFAAVSDMYISGHYWAEGSPYVFSREDARNPMFKIKVVGDISCDIDGPVACTLRPSTIPEPLYGYDPIEEKECSFDDMHGITVMAVDNLPCELPRDASRDFGEEFIKHILPSLADEDASGILERANITRNGELTSNYEYLKNYVEGK